ncbi:MAG: hypothetical protein WBC44_07280 [Planctomycetaceae bacterium]
MYDYAKSGLTIQQAMVDHVRRFPDKTERPYYILWNDYFVQTSDELEVPNSGIVRAEFVSSSLSFQQGFDMKLHGHFLLSDGQKVATLRTWKDDDYEDAVEYHFDSLDNVMYVWNVCRITYPEGRILEEKWIDNAGFWVERLAPLDRVYHCSHSIAAPPDFESLVFRLKVTVAG